MESRHEIEQISLKELILKFQDYFREVIKNWKILLLASLMVFGVLAYQHYKHIPQYQANLLFMVEGQGGAGGGLSSLLGSIGIKKEGGANPYKVIEVGKSHVLFEKLVLDSYNGERVLDYLLEHYSVIDELSKNNTDFLEYEFNDSEPYRLLDKIVLKRLKGIVWGSEKNPGLMTLNFDQKSGIFNLTAHSKNEELSLNLCYILYKHLKDFFEEEMYLNQKRSAEILAVKSDSISVLRTQKVRELARFEDSSYGISTSVNSTRKVLLNQEIQALNFAYAELIKNYEMTDVALRDIQPLFLQIEKPISPLVPTTSSLIRNLIFAIVLGIFLGTVYIVIKKIFNDIMREDENI